MSKKRVPVKMTQEEAEWMLKVIHSAMHTGSSVYFKSRNEAERSDVVVEYMSALLSERDAGFAGVHTIGVFLDGKPKIR